MNLHISHSLAVGGITTFIKSLVHLNPDQESHHHILIWKEKVGEIKEDYVISICDKEKKSEELTKLLRGYDKIFVHSLSPFMLKPLITRKDDVYLFQHGLTLGRGFLHRTLKKSFYFSAINIFNFKVICSSLFAKKKLKENVGLIRDSKVIIIPFGIKLEKRKILKNNNFNGIRIGSAGRLVPQKRFQRILEAFNNFHTNKKIEIIIAGEGPELHNLQKIASQIKNNNISIQFPGQIKNMNCFYEPLDLFILPSKGESFGLVVLEALSRKIPTIVFSDAGACVEFIKDGINGYVLDNVDQFTLLIKNLLLKKEMNILKKSAETIDLSRYNIINTRYLLDNL